ncbi:MAG TPA: hypothetical protein DCS43_05995 [Verrucomicrobia bacterium]|nr:hypothetical protein [Verrucomicrobiota bacterium]
MNAKLLRSVLFLIVLMGAAYYGLRGRHILHGDGKEYILQTQAIVFDGTLSINTAARKDYWNRTNPYGIVLGDARAPASTLSEATQAGGGFGGLYPDRSGHYRYYHYWAYSAVVAPVYALFHGIDPSGSLEYFAFRFVNVGFLLLLFGLIARQNPGGPTLAVLALLLFSPLIPYCDWQHPEIFCLSLVLASFHLSSNGKAASPLPLGLAASMNPPILLFFPCHLFLVLRSGVPRRTRDLCRLAAGYLLGGLFAVSSGVYFLYHFGTPNVISSIGMASLENASLGRMLDIFINPFVGAVYFFPMLFLLIPACLSRKTLIPCLAVFASVLLAAWLASSTSNLNAGQVGTIRYAVWLIAPLWVCPLRDLPERFSRSPRGWLVYAGLVLSFLLVAFLGTNKLLRKDIRKFGGAWRAQPEVAAIVRLSGYLGDTEIAVENILGKELDRPSFFRGVYLWDLGHGDCLWIFSERSLSRQRPVVFRLATPGDIAFRASPGQPLDWTVQGDVVTLRAFQHPRLHKHPLLGNYLTLRSKGAISAILKNQPISIRSETMSITDDIMRP